uniref:Uncharacterized protein n=1 Tax=Anopheles atroparvus TaxID=41427 RepID=A0A182ILF9_ANOAO
MGFRRRHRSRSREESPEWTGSRSALSDDATVGGGDPTSSSGTHRSSSSRHHHHHRSHHRQQHSEPGRPRRRRERPEWLKLILRAQRQFVGAILMTVGLCLSRGAQLVSAMLLGPRAQPVEERPRDQPSGSGDPAPTTAPSTSTTVATRSYALASNSRATNEAYTVPYSRAIVPPEDLD